jgi:ribose/xylose/arabinose/galactoside ABC-type transport system permease subunit
MAIRTDTPPEDDQDTRTITWQRIALNESTLRALLLTGFLVLIIIYFTTRDSAFLTRENGLNILVNASVIGIVSLGQVLTIISGGFDLSVSGTVPLGSVVFAILVNRGWGILPAVGGVLAVGAVCGLVNGLLVAKVNINPLIATLGTMSVTGGIALTIADGLQIPFSDPNAGVLAEQSLFGVNNHVWILIALSIAIFLVLRYTVFGRYLYAVGGNREAARLGGIRVSAVTTGVYVSSAMLASLAGAVLASQLLTGSGTVGTGSALLSIAAVILGGASLAGGVGGVPGTLIGVLILGTLANGMAIISVPAFYQTIATGLVLLLAVGVSQARRLRLGI